MAENIGSIYGEVKINDNTAEVIQHIDGLIDAMGNKVPAAAQKADQGTKGFDSALSGMGKTALGVALGMIGANGIVQAMGTVIRLASEARKEAQELAEAQLRLTAALGYHSEALAMQADALGDNLLVEHSLITAVQQRLANYVKDEEAVKRLTPLILDLSKATGIDMVTAANMVAKGIADDSGELARFKITVDGAQGSAERIDSVVKGLSEKFGGQAIAAREAKDWIDQLSFSWKKMLEELGAAVRDIGNDNLAKQLEVNYRANKKFLESNEDLVDTMMGPTLAAYVAVIKEIEEYEKKIKSASDAAKQSSAWDYMQLYKGPTKKELEEQAKLEKQISDERKRVAKAEKEWYDTYKTEEEKKAKDEFDAKVKQLESLNKKYDAEQKAETDLSKKGADSRHAVEQAEINYKIKNYDELAKDAELSETQRTYYAQQASAQRVELIKVEAAFQKTAIDDQMNTLADQFRDSPEMLARIEAMRSLLKKDIDTKVTIDIKANSDKYTSDMKAKYEEIKKIQVEVINSYISNMHDGLLGGVKLFTAKTTEEFEVAAQEVFAAIAKMGESSSDSLLKNIGNIGGWIGAIVSILSAEWNIIDGFADLSGKKKRSQAAAELESMRQNAILNNMQNSAIRGSIDLVKEWLYLTGKLDVSNQSQNQLKTTQKEIQAEQASTFGTSLGVGLSEVPADVLQSAAQEFGPHALYNASLEGGKLVASSGKTYRQEVLEKFPELASYFDIADKYSSNFGNLSAFMSAFDVSYGQGPAISQEEYNAAAAEYHDKDFYTKYDAAERGRVTKILFGGEGDPSKQAPKSSLVEKAEEVAARLENYTLGAGIDHTKSTSKADLEADLNAEESLGRITSLQHAKILYEAAWGIADTLEGLDKDEFSKDYDESTRAAYLAAYNTAKATPTASGFGFPGAAEGGIFNSPTMISEYGQVEAAVPLSNPARAMQVLDQINNLLPYSGNGGGTNITVQCMIDPNIPFSQDVARNMSAQIGELIVVSLQGKGIRK